MENKIPRIKQFINEYGYIYDTFDDDIIIELDDGYTKYYVIDYDYKRIYLIPQLYDE